MNKLDHFVKLIFKMIFLLLCISHIIKKIFKKKKTKLKLEDETSIVNYDFVFKVQFQLIIETPFLNYNLNY